MLLRSSVSMDCLWWVLAALQLALGDEYRLPSDVCPRHYDLALLYDLDPASNFSFFAKVDILLSAEKSTSRIILHAEDFKIGPNSAKMTKEGSEGVEVTETKYAGGYLTLTLGQALTTGENYTLSITFHGNLTEMVAGAYISSYFDKGTNKTVYLVASKFRAIWARKAFPCFDEPALKATFRLSIGHHRDYSALSNMPSLTDANSNALKNVWPWDTINETIKKEEEQFMWSHFDTSPPMSTYVVAWVVSKFTHVKEPTQSGSQIRIWARPAVIEQTKYALKIGPKMMEKYNEWFGISYPLPKLDIVAIPGAGDPVSESWGLIQTKEVVLLHDETRHIPLNKETVSHAIAQDMVHQWFGNLVTMDWWSELWIFESFAAYIAALNLAAVEPEWGFENNLAGLNMISVLNKDLLESSRPLSVSSEEFNQLISFKKGYVLIRMLAKALGEENFRQGIKNYLIIYSYNNTGEDELWQELALAEHGHAGLNQDMNLTSIMETWTNPMYPILNVNREYVKGHNLRIRQKLSQSCSASAKWWVPLGVLCQNEAVNKSRVEWVAMHDKSLSEYNHSADNDQWVLLNTEMIAPYRVYYDFRNWELLRRTLHSSNYTAIPMLSRVQLLSDAFEFAWNGQLSFGIPLHLVTYLKREQEYLPIKVALEALFRMEVMFMRGPGYGPFLNFMQNLINDSYIVAGSIMGEVTRETSVERSRVQVLLNKWACRVELDTCQELAIALFQTWMDANQGDGRNPIVREMRPTVYCIAIARGKAGHWNFLQAKQNVTNDPAESAVILRALACSEEVWILSRYLEWAITPDSSLRSQDAAAVFDAVIMSKVGFLVAKDFIYNRIEDIFKAFKNQPGQIGTFLKALASRFTMQHDIDEFKRWHKRNERFMVGSQELVDEADEEPRKNMDWLKKYRTFVMQTMQESFPTNESQIEWRSFLNYDDNIAEDNNYVIKGRFRGHDKNLGPAIQVLVNQFTTDRELDEFLSWSSTNEKYFSESIMVINQAVEGAQINLKWVQDFQRYIVNITKEIEH